MKAYRTSEGEILYPRVVYTEAGDGDGWGLGMPAADKEAAEWEHGARPLPPPLLPLVERLRARAAAVKAATSPRG